MAAKKKLKICIDKIVKPIGMKGRLAAVRNSIWGATRLRVCFLDGDETLHQKVIDGVKDWEKNANMSFVFGAPKSKSDIRITFDEENDGTSWSYVGKEANDFKKEATMNIGWLTDATKAEAKQVILHEVGHALGCLHEHESPAAKIPWNKEAVYKYYKGPPNEWTKKDVDENLFETYEETLTVHTKLDKKSIMMYPIPREHVTSAKFVVGWNNVLSAQDKKFIRTLYPFV